MFEEFLENIKNNKYGDAFSECEGEIIVKADMFTDEYSLMYLNDTMN